MAKRLNAKALRGAIQQMVKEATAKPTNENKVVNVDLVMPSEAAEEKIIRKVYELQPEWKISLIAKRRFMNLPSYFQNGAGKEACVKEALAMRKDLIPDPTRYWIWMIDETRKLTRVWDFKETCEEAGLDPQTVAQHLVLEGKMVCNAIRMDGLAAYGSNIRMFVEPLFHDEFQLFSRMATVKAESVDEEAPAAEAPAAEAPAGQAEVKEEGADA